MTEREWLSQQLASLERQRDAALEQIREGQQKALLCEGALGVCRKRWEGLEREREAGECILPAEINGEVGA